MATAEQEALFVAEYPRLVGALALYTGDRDVARDLAHETLARALVKWDAVQRARAPGAYLQRMGLNVARSSHRRRRRTSAPVAHGGGGHDAVQETPERVDVWRGVGELPPRQREAVILRFFCDLSVRDTAAVMRCREGTVKALCHQAIASLRGSVHLAGGHDRG